MDSQSNRSISWLLEEYNYYIYNDIRWIKVLKVYNNNNEKLYLDINIYEGKINLNILYKRKNLTIKDISNKKLSAVFRNKAEELKEFKAILKQDVQQTLHMYIKLYSA